MYYLSQRTRNATSAFQQTGNKFSKFPGLNEVPIFPLGVHHSLLLHISNCSVPNAKCSLSTTNDYTQSEEKVSVSFCHTPEHRSLNITDCFWLFTDIALREVHPLMQSWCQRSFCHLFLGELDFILSEKINTRIYFGKTYTPSLFKPLKMKLQPVHWKYFHTAILGRLQSPFVCNSYCNFIVIPTVLSQELSCEVCLLYCPCWAQGWNAETSEVGHPVHDNSHIIFPKGAWRRTGATVFQKDAATLMLYPLLTLTQLCEQFLRDKDT